MATSVKSLRIFSPSHVVLGILAIITGIASMNVTEYYNGVFGMGIWLGAWIFLTGLAGLASAVKPGNYYRIGTFLGCCVVAIVILTICSIIIGTVVLKHFQFESTVTRDYYKDKGVFGREDHVDYYKPDKYFEDRNKSGRVGVAVYSCLLIIIICDVILNIASVYVCRDLATGNGQASTAGANNRRTSPMSIRQGQANAGTLPISELGLTGQNWAEVVFQGTPGTIQPIHLIQNSEFQYFTPYKLPNYAELYPDGLINPAAANEQALVSNVPDEPPPAYTPTADVSSLPASSIVVAANPNPLTAEDQSLVQESAALSGTLTPLAVRNTSPESREHTEMIELSSQYTGSSTPVLSLHPGDLETPMPRSSTPSTNLNDSTALAQINPLPYTPIITDLSAPEIGISEDSHSSGSLPNLVEVEDLGGTLSVESQNSDESTNSERSSVETKTR